MPRDDALVIVDDVSHVYPDVLKRFKDIVADPAWPLDEIECDERLGILRRRSA